MNHRLRESKAGKVSIRGIRGKVAEIQVEKKAGEDFREEKELT